MRQEPVSKIVGSHPSHYNTALPAHVYNQSRLEGLKLNRIKLSLHPLPAHVYMQSEQT